MAATVNASFATDSNKTKADNVEHTADAVIGDTDALGHATSSSLWSHRGTKKVIVNGEWKNCPVKVLRGGVWAVARVAYYDGNEWVDTYR